MSTEPLIYILVCLLFSLYSEDKNIQLFWILFVTVGTLAVPIVMNDPWLQDVNIFTIIHD